MDSPNSENFRKSDTPKPNKLIGLRTIQFTPFERGLFLSVTFLLILLAVPRAWLIRRPPPEEISNVSGQPTVFLADSTIRFPLDVNKASMELLQVIPGIGPKLAQRIIVARIKQPFRSLPEIAARVPGIGAYTLERITPYLTLDTNALRGNQ